MELLFNEERVASNIEDLKKYLDEEIKMAVDSAIKKLGIDPNEIETMADLVAKGYYVSFSLSKPRYLKDKIQYDIITNTYEVKLVDSDNFLYSIDLAPPK